MYAKKNPPPSPTIEPATSTAFEYEHLAPSQSVSCKGDDCKKPIQKNDLNEPSSISTETHEIIAKNENLKVKEKKCSLKSNEDCVALAEMKESKGERAEALIFYKRACQPPDVDIEACGDFGRLTTANEVGKIRQECENDQLHLCLSVAGYFYTKNEKQEAKKWMQYACDHGLTEGCANVGFMLNDQEIAQSKNKCDQGSLKDCLYIAGAGSFRDNPEQQAQYFAKSCDLGDQTSCIYAGDEIPDEKISELSHSCLWDGTLKSCLLLIGKNSNETHDGKDPELQKKLIRKACDLGNKTACNAHIN